MIIASKFSYLEGNRVQMYNKQLNLSFPGVSPIDVLCKFKRR